MFRTHHGYQKIGHIHIQIGWQAVSKQPAVSYSEIVVREPSWDGLAHIFRYESIEYSAENMYYIGGCHFFAFAFAFTFTSRARPSIFSTSRVSGSVA